MGQPPKSPWQPTLVSNPDTKLAAHGQGLSAPHLHGFQHSGQECSKPQKSITDFLTLTKLQKANSKGHLVATRQKKQLPKKRSERSREASGVRGFSAGTSAGRRWGGPTLRCGERVGAGPRGPRYEEPQWAGEQWRDGGDRCQKWLPKGWVPKENSTDFCVTSFGDLAPI